MSSAKNEPKEIDMLSSIDITSSVAVYVQIENHVQFAIASGRLKPGDQLPSVRELSERLNVNPNTVAKAYRDLEVMGLLYTRRGMGVFVNRGIEQKCKEDCRRRVYGRLHEVVTEAKASGLPVKELHEFVDKSYSFDGPLYSNAPDTIAAVVKGGKKKGK